jgi:hypothetical protein
VTDQLTYTRTKHVRHQRTIDRAVARGTLTKQQGRAADKFYLHWCRAGMADRKLWFAASTAFLDADLLRAVGIHNDIPTGDDAETLRAAIKTMMMRAGVAMFKEYNVPRLIECVVCRNMTFEQAGLTVGPGLQYCGDVRNRKFGRNSAEILAKIHIKGALNVLAHEWGIPETGLN